MDKVEQPYDLLKQKTQQVEIAYEDLSFDKLMVPYCTRHLGKQFIREKTILFRCALWVLASATGVSYKIEI